MHEITNENFYQKYEEIVQDFSSSDFLAIDCEFSGLSKYARNRSSLFDTLSQRYEKLRRGCDEFVAFQIGISSFKYTKKDKYKVSTYTFYLFPKAYSEEEIFFTCDARCIQFLCEQNFDFNKVFHQGITFLVSSREKEMRKEIVSGSLERKLKSELNPEVKELIQSYVRKIRDWWGKAEEGSSMVLSISGEKPFTAYLIRSEIEAHVKGIKVSCDYFSELKVEKTDVDVNPTTKHEELFSLVSGFTRLMKTVFSMQKPIVGHNMFLDLIIIYKMFIAPLPTGYQHFKKEILKLSPHVYDTKYLSFELRKTIGKRELWSTNALSYLYKFFTEGNGVDFVADMPVIQYESDTPLNEQYHNSGFDSYCTGFVFLKMAHMFAVWDSCSRAFRTVALGNGPNYYFGAVKAFKNKINVMRGANGYIALDGPDPESDRPGFLVVESRENEDINISELSMSIAKYDRADIRSLSRSKVLIASSNEFMSKKIFLHLKNSKKYKLTKYKPPADSNLICKCALLVAVCGIGITSLFCLNNKLKL